MEDRRKAPSSDSKGYKLTAYPYSDHSNFSWRLEGDKDEVVSTWRVRGQPHVCIVTCAIDAVNEVGRHTGIAVVCWQDVDVQRVGQNLRRKKQSS